MITHNKDQTGSKREIVTNLTFFTHTKTFLLDYSHGHVAGQAIVDHMYNCEWSLSKMPDCVQCDIASVFIGEKLTAVTSYLGEDSIADVEG